MLKQIINQEQSDKAAKKDEPAAKPNSDNQQQSRPASSPNMGSSKNILSSDVEIKGNLKFTNDLIMDGRLIEGAVISDGDLTVGENAQIDGQIQTRSVTVFGTVNGNITVTDRCELKQNAQLHGDITAGKLAIEEGAIFMGSSIVGAAAASAASKANAAEHKKASDDKAADDKKPDHNEGDKPKDQSQGGDHNHNYNHNG